MNAVERQTILIVDDSLLICQQIKTILKDEDLEIQEAHTGEEALNRVEECCPDLILLDVVLPDIEGYELCQGIRERDKGNAAIVFITSKDSDKDVVRGFSLGAVDYIKKPFTKDELKSRVVAHLQMQKQKAELSRMNRELQNNMEKLNYMAFRDSLTGLYNRRYIKDDLMGEIASYGRDDVECVLIMADVDNFKMINDQYGHENGDVVLICISNIMESICRRHRVVRWGGEEFLIILFSVTTDEAFEISERIRKEVESFPVIPEDLDFTCSITLGLSVYDDSKDMKENIDKADRALYRGKRSGKNRSVWYDASMEIE